MNEEDPEQTVIEYRRVIAERDAQTTEIGRAEYDRMARQLRREWQAWAGGDDELHEMAFGEPVD